MWPFIVHREQKGPVTLCAFGAAATSCLCWALERVAALPGITLSFGLFFCSWWEMVVLVLFLLVMVSYLAGCIHKAVPAGEEKTNINKLECLL